MDETEYVKSGKDIEEVRKAVLDSLQKEKESQPSTLHVGADDADKFKAAAVDGLVMRAGLNVESPAAGANNMRGMSLKDLAIKALTYEGQSASSLLEKSADEILYMLCGDSRAYYNPTAVFPAILDQTIEKSIVQLYQMVPTTFEAFTTKGSVKDFKPTPAHEYVIGGVGDFLLVPENGEIKADMPQTELLPQRQIQTYGKQFTMTRQAFINDDIGFLTQVPALYGTKAKQTIDKQVYKILFDNAAIFDGTPLFSDDHNNLMADASEPTQAMIQNMITKMQLQKDQFGEAIYITPQYVVVPVGYGFDLDVIFHSAQIVGSANNDINPLYNKPFTVVESPVLNAMAGEDACPWFMVANQASCRGIEVDYLNGNETPSVRRMELPGTLGYTWDMWLDWGITVLDWRGIVRNNGVAMTKV
ncbi:MAG: Mu-like prophage major head subunit gpT family protein [Bacteroidales bacterium]|nr:Mu-like prophage major head subunit gpT family protein [Bacteroidales bacterium]